ncbi:GNAT family N-acetyltransferase [Legionella jamestowniensis]|uniref:GNAT family N-acetyltransferase n=1 Tax=Legionella jamestowniensis TaxID=455 RepID=UPI0008EE2EEE|nr:GNAT family N-acetyltransferase [Legionella jamestowniensis]SFM08410.1 Acetyltransferase (GNAT) family protein [Legionella jamestowniensis DSM 19215]
MQKEVRFANHDDFNFIYETLREDLREQGVLHRFKYSPEEFKNAIFGEKPLARFLILTMDDQRAGFANFSIDHRNFTVNTLANLYLNDLFVVKEYRRMKGATLLMEKLIHIAKSELCGRIEFFVLSDNVEALAFYKNTTKSRSINDGLHYMRLEIES